MKRFGVLIKLFLVFTLVFLNVEGSEFREGVNTVVIDPGHGGDDPGTLGSFSKEKDVALNIALKVGKYIEDKFDDVNVIYTRKTDTFIRLFERAQIANESRADIFISIHCNSSPNESAFGTETYMMGLDQTNANLKVASRENSVILLEDDYEANYGGFDPNSPEAYIIFSLYQSAFLDRSLDFATRVESQFADRVQRKSRGIKQAGFLVLYKTAMPSVLVETGFLSNKNEEQYLNSEEGKVYIASAIYRAFKSYKMDIENIN